MAGVEVVVLRNRCGAEGGVVLKKKGLRLELYIVGGRLTARVQVKAGALEALLGRRVDALWAGRFFM